MKFSYEKWVAEVKQAAADLAPAGHGPSSGPDCAMASLRLIAAGLAEELKTAKPGELGPKLASALGELFVSNYEAKDSAGFCSNASAAAKAAGFTAEKAKAALPAFSKS